MADLLAITGSDLERSKDLMDFKCQFDKRVRGIMGIRADAPPGETLRQELESLTAKVEQLQKFAEKHEDRDNRMASYLENLDALRPVEGQTVIQAFKVVIQDLEVVKQQVQTQADNMQKHTNHVKE